MTDVPSPPVERGRRTPARTVGVVTALLLLGAYGRSAGWHPLDPFASVAARQPLANVVWDGDSHSAPGFGTTTPDVTVDGLQGEVLLRNQAVGGSTVDMVAQRAPAFDGKLLTVPGMQNVAVVWVAANDLGEGDDPAARHDALRTYYEERRARGWKVVALSVLPRSYPLDVPGFEQRRQRFNDLMRAHWQEYADVFVDLGAHPQLGRPGAQDDPALYGQDRTHMLDAGREIVAAEVRTGLATLGLR
ncbi:MAG: SGNH/GDSL hydrolase family protein [Acidimicrobiales bacterium]|nr:SGNH/GDSL hydrolase family protein [Acidimicrobiales bacterium]